MGIDVTSSSVSTTPISSALTRKLAVVAEPAKALTDLIDTERSIRLEIVIVLLIVSENVLPFIQCGRGTLIGAARGGIAEVGDGVRG